MTGYGSAREWSEHDVTSLAEEIRLLVEMVVERAAPWLDGVIAAGHSTGRDEGAARPEEAKETTDCGWCPLCAIVAVVRGERPEFAARLLEQAAALIALLRAVLADRWQPQEGVHMPGFRPPARPEDSDPPGTPGADTPGPTDAPGSTTARVQRIEVRRAEEWAPGAGNWPR